MAEALILTHGDLDGLVCGVLLLTRLDEEARVTITNERKLASHLREAAESDPPPADVFITDIPLDAASAEGVLQALERVKGGGARVHLYDHHAGWETPLGNEIRGWLDACVVDAKRTTAAVLVKEACFGQDPAAGRWLELLSKKGESPDASIREDFGALVALMQPPHYGLTREVLLSMARGEPPDPARRRLCAWHHTERPALEQTLAERAEVLVTATGRRIGWLDMRHGKWRLFVTPRVMELHGVELVAIVNWKGVTLGAEGIDRGSDLSFLHGAHEHDGVALQVVGHKAPVLIRPASGRVTQAFLSAVQSFLRERLWPARPCTVGSRAAEQLDLRDDALDEAVEGGGVEAAGSGDGVHLPALLDAAQPGLLQFGADVDLRHAPADALAQRIVGSAGAAVEHERRFHARGDLLQALQVDLRLPPVDAVDGADGDGEAVKARLRDEVGGLVGIGLQRVLLGDADVPLEPGHVTEFALHAGVEPMGDLNRRACEAHVLLVGEVRAVEHDGREAGPHALIDLGQLHAVIQVQGRVDARALDVPLDQGAQGFGPAGQRVLGRRGLEDDGSVRLRGGGRNGADRGAVPAFEGCEGTALGAGLAKEHVHSGERHRDLRSRHNMTRSSPQHPPCPVTWQMIREAGTVNEAGEEGVVGGSGGALRNGNQPDPTGDA